MLVVISSDPSSPMWVWTFCSPNSVLQSYINIYGMKQSHIWYMTYQMLRFHVSLCENFLFMIWYIQGFSYVLKAWRQYAKAHYITPQPHNTSNLELLSGNKFVRKGEPLFCIRLHWASSSISSVKLLKRNLMPGRPVNKRHLQVTTLHRQTYLPFNSVQGIKGLRTALLLSKNWYVNNAGFWGNGLWPMH